MSHTNARALLALDRVVAIAHRGGSRLRPENTLAAFDHAMTLGVDGLECDVHLSVDGEVVVIHDDTLDRTTDAAGPVSARTADELAQVDAGFHFRDRDVSVSREHVGVPRLTDVIGRYTSVPVIVEIKGDDVELARRTVAIVRALRAERRVILAGFSQTVLDEARRIAPEVATSASRSEVQAVLKRSQFWLPAARTPAQVLQVPFRLKGREIFGRRFVRAAKGLGTPVHAWVIDDPGDMTRLIAMGVTGLISDRPDLAVRAARIASSPLPDMIPSDARAT
jgi:glycerophosphoryl diester phosphodiesterase